MDKDDIIRARELDDETLQKLIDEIPGYHRPGLRHPMDGADVTKYLVNPGFETGDDTSWTGYSSITDIAFTVIAEGIREERDFDFYQVVKNAPVGVYGDFSTGSFVRQGANDIGLACIPW